MSAVAEKLDELEEEFRESVESEAGPPAEEPSEEDKELEGRARRMGWRPQSEYGGNPSRWVDAKTFIERGEHELPILRERFRKLDTTLDQTNTRLADTEKRLTEAQSRIKDQTDVLTELRDMSRASEERGYSRAMRELHEREVQAVKEADVASFEAIQREKEALEAGRPKPAPAPPVDTKKVEDEAPKPKLNPVVETWVAENPWYGKDQLLTVYAMEADRDVESQYAHWSLTEKLAEVKKRVMAKFPEKFNNSRREAPATVGTSSAPPPKPKGRTAKDLPREAKEALARFKAQIPGYTDDEYLAQYDWRE